MPADAPGLYVHTPFCLSKCRYCGFYSETVKASDDDRDRIDGWREAVLREAKLYRDRFGPFDTVYLGGGTPSLLDDRQLEALVSGLRDALGIRDDAEVTIEVNPGDVTERRARVWKNLGIARASVGVQSFDDGALAFLGRRHNAEQAVRALAALRAAGFASLSVDLIWAIPTQPLDRSLASLERALSHGPEHMSCYELTLERGTPLFRDVADRRVVPWGDEAAADAALAVWTRLEAAGYEHYEVSSFARSPEHRSRHNTKYWRHVPYLGLGPAAHSFDGHRRWANVRSVHDYAEALSASRRPLEFEEQLTAQQLREERIALGIRTADGVSLGDVDAAIVDRLAREGMVRGRGSRIQPTQQGMLVADALAAALLNDAP